MRGRTSPPLFPDVVEGTVHLRPYEGRGKEYLLRTKTREVGLHMVRVPLPVSFCMKSLWQLPATETAVLSLRGDLSIIEEKRSCRWDGAAWKPSRELAAALRAMVRAWPRQPRKIDDGGNKVIPAQRAQLLAGTYAPKQNRERVLAQLRQMDPLLTDDGESA